LKNMLTPHSLPCHTAGTTSDVAHYFKVKNMLTSHWWAWSKSQIWRL